jgi:hypothetical protein
VVVSINFFFLIKKSNKKNQARPASRSDGASNKKAEIFNTSLKSIRWLAEQEFNNLKSLPAQKKPRPTGVSRVALIF